MSGLYIQTYTGRKFYILNPRIEEVDISDIAVGLACQPRFGGHTRHFPLVYSVAQHVVLASMLARYGKRWALMHDAPEGYIHDVSTPLKRELPPYKGIENLLANVICARFGVERSTVINAEVKRVDTQLLFLEARWLLKDPSTVEDADWMTGVEKPQGALPDVFPGIRIWPPGEAYERFLQRFDELFR